MVDAKVVVVNFLILFVFVRCGTSPSCPEGSAFSPYSNQWCYKFVNQSASFDDAEYFCENAGGFLAEVNDQFTNNFLYHNAKTNFMSGAFWIGGQVYNTPKDSLWVWVRQSERVLLSFFDWADPEAGTSGTGDCLSVSTENGRWTPQNNSVKLPYVCQIPTTSSVTACESEWTYFEKTNQWYKVFAQKNVTQAVAEQNCVYEGGHLVSIHSDDENTLVGQMTSTLYVGQWTQVGVWIGLQTNAQGKYSWTDGTKANYFNWGDIDPNNTPPACVAFIPDGRVDPPYNTYIRKWVDAVCADQLNRYVCKKPFHTCQDNHL